MSAKLTVFYDTKTRIARVTDKSDDTAKANEVKWGDFVHVEVPEPDNARSKLYGLSHAIYKHVADLAYHNGITDMQYVSIKAEYTVATKLEIEPVTITAGYSKEVTVKVTPEDSQVGYITLHVSGEKDFASISGSVQGKATVHAWKAGKGKILAIDSLTGLRAEATLVIKE